MGPLFKLKKGSTSARRSSPNTNDLTALKAATREATITTEKETIAKASTTEAITTRVTTIASDLQHPITETIIARIVAATAVTVRILTGSAHIQTCQTKTGEVESRKTLAVPTPRLIGKSRHFKLTGYLGHSSLMIGS